ncbi:type II secretion system protein GspE [bacterium]|nr:type II secretion system protein GspE [bacterium]
MLSLHEDRLANVIAQRRLLGEGELHALEARAQGSGKSVEETLLAEGVFSRRQLLEILENQYFCPSVELPASCPDPAALQLLPQALAERHDCLPVDSQGGALRVAFADPDDKAAREAASRAAGREVLPLVTLRGELAQRRREWYASQARALAETGRQPAAPPSAPAPRAAVEPIAGLEGKPPTELVDVLLSAAARRGATDIHVEQTEDALALRLRLDGILHTVARLPREQGPGVVSRLKILASLDIAEHRLPQDGRFSTRDGDRAFDLRMSVLPAQYGEKVVLRLLEKKPELLDLAMLRLPPPIMESFREFLDNPMGFYLVSGPTGSGKTTTLYAALQSLDREALNIATLEDPIEYSLPGLTQTQVNEEAGLSFAAGLRSLLRQDPDVILVGEMRDLETVEIACRAALTGHKVLSTIHTNDACQVITRLLDMGTAPHLIAATLRGVLAQRLVRKVCPQCSEQYTPNDTELALLGYPDNATLVRGGGCAHCAGSGYKGRMGIYEYFKVEEDIHRLILDRASSYAIRYAAKRAGMILMADYAKRAVLAGDTTIAEIQRVVLSEAPRDQLCPNCQRVVNLDFSVCPYCQTTLKETCHGCGRPVEPTWESCPACGHHLEREWERVYCRHCLAPVRPEWESCSFCGGALR